MWSFITVSSYRISGAAILLALSMGVIGCNKGTPTGTVSGKVTYLGKAVTVGTINFYAPERGAGAEAKLDPSGAFKFENPLEAGSYKVYIQPPIPEPLPPGQAVQQMPKLNIPPKYQDSGQTPVTVEVKAGANELPIQLKG